MLVRLLTIFILLFNAQNWAVNCSDPKTLSDPQVDASHPHLSSNEDGDVILTWISEEQKKQRIEASHKKQNSSWSLPESISNKETEIFENYCFVNETGDLFVAWLAKNKNNESFVHVAEKLQDKPWNLNQKWILGSKFRLCDIAMDSIGNLTSIGKKEPFPPTENVAIATFTKSPAQIEQKIDIRPLGKDVYSISACKMAINKNGAGYAFWCQSSLKNRLLMCQRIINNRLFSEPEIICSLNGFLFDIEVALNEKEDIIIAFEDSEDDGKILIKIDNVWSDPFCFKNKKEEMIDYKVAIDSVGNAMAVWDSTIDETDRIKSIYKPVDHPWQKAIIAESDDAETWNANLQPDGNGNFVVLWQRERRGRNVIYGRSFSTETQTWSNAERLTPEGKSCFNYSFTFSTPGKGHIAWVLCPNGFDHVIQVAELFN